MTTPHTAPQQGAPGVVAGSDGRVYPGAIVMELLSKSPATVADPYEHYRVLREAAPRFRLVHPTGVGYVVTTYDDCRFALRSPALDKSAQRPQLGDSRGEGHARTLLFLDGEEHTRLRGLVSRAFTPRRVQKLHPRLAGFVDELLEPVTEAVGSGGTIDLVAMLAFPLPVMVIGELVGVPRPDWPMLRTLTRQASGGLEMFATPESLASSDEALREMEVYFTDLVRRRRADPRDDLISALAQVEVDGDVLTTEELISVVVLLFGAGFQTMTDLIGLGTLTLHRNPDQLAKVRADPALVPAAVEEMLRYDSPVHVLGRAAVQETVFPDGQPLHAGEHVITIIGAANRDPARYRDPETFDVTRFTGDAPPEAPLSFSWGPHHCLGAQLARAEGTLVFGKLLQRFSHLAVDEEALRWRRSTTFRGIEQLHVELAP